MNMTSENNKQEEVMTGIVPAWEDWITWQDAQLSGMSANASTN